MLILSVAILSGCGPIDYYSIIGRPKVVHYRGINPEKEQANDSGPQYFTKWESQYTDGQYKRKEMVELTTDSESAGDDGFADDGSSDEYCEPTYTFSPPPQDDYTGDTCVRLCSRKQDKCKEDIRMKMESCKHYNAMAQIEYGRCLASGSLNCYRSIHDCFEEVPDTPEQCVAEYRLCYESCGGSVTNSCDK